MSACPFCAVPLLSRGACANRQCWLWTAAISAPGPRMGYLEEASIDFATKEEAEAAGLVMGRTLVDRIDAEN